MADLDATLTINRITKLLADATGYPRANMAATPKRPGFVVRQPLWEMIPVILVHWAYDVDPMSERQLTAEVRKLRAALANAGYRTQTKGNLFFVLPSAFHAQADMFTVRRVTASATPGGDTALTRHQTLAQAQAQIAADLADPHTVSSGWHYTDVSGRQV